jgi:outer membrane immunogenic protein
MRKALVLSALLASAAPAAYAADAIDAVPAAPEAVEQAVPAGWDGVYLGAMGGAGWLKSELDNGVSRTSHTETGGLLGAFGGYNTQLSNNVVLGVEGDFSYNWNRATRADTDFGTDWQGSVRARAGYAINDSALLYGAAGWTVARGYVDPPGADKGHKALNGYTLGLGVDYKFTNNMFARAEYRFNDFGSESIKGVDFNPQQHQVILGVGYKF